MEYRKVLKTKTLERKQVIDKFSRYERMDNCL